MIWDSSPSSCHKNSNKCQVSPVLRLTSIISILKLINWWTDNKTDRAVDRKASLYTFVAKQFVLLSSSCLSSARQTRFHPERYQGARKAIATSNMPVAAQRIQSRGWLRVWETWWNKSYETKVDCKCIVAHVSLYVSRWISPHLR